MARIGIFIFRRDLRFYDNIGLIEAVNDFDKVMCLFIFDPRQITGQNKWKSDPSIVFMTNSLRDLAQQAKRHGAKLHFVAGVAEDVIEAILRHDTAEKIAGIYHNADYTPFSKKRDMAIERLCEQYGIEYESWHDALVFEDFVTKQNGDPYLKYTPYLRATSRQKQPNKPRPLPRNARFVSGAEANDILAGLLRRRFAGLAQQKIVEYDYALSQLSKKALDGIDPIVHGGREEGLALLKRATRDQGSYDKERDFLDYETTFLSAHNKFCTISPREVYWAFKKTNRTLLQELIWREFFLTLMNFDENALKTSYWERFSRPPKNLSGSGGSKGWLGGKSRLDAWKEARTGFPVVDAAMRQIMAEKYMHNRARMIVASFLTKTLGVNWRHGEKWFAHNLVDYDPAQNFYNWQTVYGSGPFALPYFRVFSMEAQSKKFDPDCQYIKYWIPELADVPNDDIHTWPRKYYEYDDIDYPEPIVDEKSAKANWLKWVKKLK